VRALDWILHDSHQATARQCRGLDYLSLSIEWLATTASTTDRFKIANVGSASEREVAGIVEVVQKGIALNRLMRLLRETTTTRHWRSVVMVMMTVIVVVVVAVPD